MGSNPLRAPPKPFIKREVKREHNRQIPPAQKQIIDNPADYKEYPLRACTQEEIENVKTHILKFQSKSTVDPVNTFTKPIRLHRKETKNLQYQLTRAEIEQRQRENAEAKRIEAEERAKYLEEKEKNGIVKEKADLSKVAPEPVKTEEEKKQEKLEKQQAQIAPDGGARKKQNPFQRKTRQIKAVDENTKKLRYEEYYPWVMEDFDGKNTWVGSYEAGSSDAYVLLIPDGDGFKMMPADKVYRFTPRNKYSTLTLEEAEARMEKSKTQQIPRWFMKHLDEKEQKLTRFERTKKKLKTVVGTSGEGGDENNNRRDENDDLDYDEDFADDEEAPIVDGDEEENKESERKIKMEMRSANAMGLHDEEGGDDEYDDLFETRKVDKEGERLRKALNKTDMTGIYESDDEINPYLNESDLEIDEDSNNEDNEGNDLNKQNSQEPNSPNSKTNKSPTPGRTIKVKSINHGIVTLSALPSILIKFPKGEWNPNAKKRTVIDPSSDDERSHKRIKIEDDQKHLPKRSTSPNVKHEDTDADIIQVPSETDVDLLTEQDIIEIVSKEKLTAKELIHKLKFKLSKHPDNKNRIKTLVKQLLKNQDGFLVLK
ncbi:Transcription initiation factor IIF subunit alpha [Wickerhamomyces ciferrii]|uniref:Transcription initiation factor IIF subunit alpha n=1 Tax=Wickerhamomyces ciferrii (strain ATCC 14091 / BCRC 22168 / CBS 111 / JCM 3599 / NBRC 0793 / NRRL Y-1031 F-60-10) TaxID=1206466 RepID=K0K8P3_WICCF|nr:Transcription initiation factor IIF subunit alpha [Wickerhamomyces ciferrii]CCH41210.1 Transcription initiation factor IIF subunit alpha [Wickerhamomyces ciferrii]